MDIFSKLPLSRNGSFACSLAGMQRVSPHEMPVRSIGCHYTRVHELWSNWPHGGTDFSINLVLRGTGTCRIFQKKRIITAPCVFTTWPGEPMQFGPDNTWDEFYICYATTIMPILKKRLIALRHRPIWPIRNPSAVQQQLLELGRMLNDPRIFGQADRIDRLCDTLISDTIITHEACLIPDNTERLIKEIELDLSQNLGQPFDFQTLARKHGLSETHLRRLWKRFFTVPPAHHAMQRRIQEACRMLAETDWRINEIAAKLGYQDTLYFSKHFHRLVGQTASEYRAGSKRPQVQAKS